MKMGTKIDGWDDLLLRGIAVYKFFKALIAVSLSIYIFRLIREQVPDILTTIAEKLHINLENHLFQKILDWAAPVINQHIHSVGIIILVYAFLFAAEGTGLYLRKTWAEYLAIVSTCIPLPIEIYEVVTQVALWNVVVLLANLFMLLFLIHRVYTVHQLLKLEQQQRKSENERTKNQIKEVNAIPVAASNVEP